MTVPVQTPYNSYTYVGSSTFVYRFQIILATDLQVSVGGSVQPPSNYTISGVGSQTGGSINYTGTLTAGQLVELQRVTVLQRANDYQNEGDFLAATFNADFDRLWQALQESQRTQVQSIRVPEAGGVPVLPAAAARANTFLGFDLNGSLVLLAGAVGSAASLALQYAGSAGSSLIGWSNGLAGGEIRTVQAKLREAPSFSDMVGVDITGVLDSTAAMQALITATNGLLIGTPGAIYKVSAPLLLHSNIEIDLRGATVNWTGAVVSSANKASRWDNAVFACGAVAPGIQYTNVKVRNGTINCNNWGCAVFFKRVDGIAITDITTSLANCAGIAVLDCTDGEVKRNKLTDCAADPAQGFNPATDLEGWSDGIIVWYGSQAISIENNTVINTRVGTGRCGIVLDDASSGSAETLRKTAAITVRNNTVQGYDRQFHNELTWGCTFEANFGTFVDSGAKTYNCAFTDWNTVDSVWVGNRMRSSKALANISGSSNVSVIGGSIAETNAAYTGSLFLNVGSVAANVKFRGVDLNYGIGNANITTWTVLFEDCSQTASAWTLSDAYSGVTLRVVRGTLNNVEFHGRFAVAADRYEFDGCEFIGYGGTNALAAMPASTGTIYLRNVRLPAGSIQIFCGTTITINDMEYNKLPTITGAPLFTILDGEYLGTAAPVAGTWGQGQKFRNTNPASASFIGWVCTATGTPGTWKTYGLIS